MIVSNLLHNVEVSRQVVRSALARLPAERDCGCETALESAMVTALDIVPGETLRRLEPIIGKYVSQKVGG
jgi:5'-methylthioadenosine phosphorylase